LFGVTKIIVRRHYGITNYLKTLIMRTTIDFTPTEAREHVFFTNFKNSRRIRWSEHRRFSF